MSTRNIGFLLSFVQGQKKWKRCLHKRFLLVFLQYVTVLLICSANVWTIPYTQNLGFFCPMKNVTKTFLILHIYSVFPPLLPELSRGSVGSVICLPNPILMMYVNIATIFRLMCTKRRVCSPQNTRYISTIALYCVKVYIDG